MDLFHTAFRNKNLSTKCTWKTVVLCPKGNGYCRGIGIIKVLWKTVLVLINHQIGAEVTHHNSSFGFRAGRHRELLP